MGIFAFCQRSFLSADGKRFIDPVSCRRLSDSLWRRPCDGGDGGCEETPVGPGRGAFAFNRRVGRSEIY